MKLSSETYKFIIATIIATIFWVIYFWANHIYFSLTLSAILVAILYIEWKRLFKKNQAAFWLLMPLYPVLPFLMLIWMNHTPEYHKLVYYIFTLTFAFDATAYLTGSLFSKTKISPSANPAKTFEGFLGGYLGALTFFMIAQWDAGIVLPFVFSFFFTLLICGLAFVGDLFESYLKQCAGLASKENFFPGHGGFLGRFDAVIMVTYFFFLYKDILIKILP